VMTAVDVAGAGARMDTLMGELFPICRSITGDGVRQTLEAVARRIPLEVHEVPSGTQVLDWTVPEEWNIRDAYIAEPGGARGDWTPVRVDDRLVGFRIKTTARGRSVTAHAAWLTTPELARDIVIRTTGRMRVPEPMQRARELSGRLRTDYERLAGTGLQDGIHV